MKRSQGRWVSWVVPGLLLGCAAASGFAQAGGRVGRDLPPLQKALPDAVGRKGTLPIVSNGYLLSYARTIRSRGSQAIFLTPLRTGKTLALPFWLPGASSIRLDGGAVSSAGDVLLAGSYVRARAGAEANFVARVDRRGRVLSVKDLGDYTPERLCAAGDGTFWTLGQVWSREKVAPSAGGPGDYALLRQYSADGALKGSYLSRSLLPRGVVLNYRARMPQARSAFLRCGDHSVAAYLGRGTRFFLWTEVNTATGEDRSWSVRTPPQATMTGLALLGEHTAYASFRPGGLYRLEMVPSRPARWTPVPAPAAGSAATAGGDRAAASILLGRDGPNLVHLMGATSPRKDPTVYWSAPAAPEPDAGVETSAGRPRR